MVVSKMDDMKIEIKFDILRFRKELRNLKDNSKKDLSDDTFLLLINSIVPSLKRKPENINELAMFLKIYVYLFLNI